MKKILLSVIILTFIFRHSALAQYNDLYDVNWDFEKFDSTSYPIPVPMFHSVSLNDYEDFNSMDLQICDRVALSQNADKHSGDYAGLLQSIYVTSGSCSGTYSGFGAYLNTTDTSFYVTGYYKAHLTAGDSAFLIAYMPSTGIYTIEAPFYTTTLSNCAVLLLTADSNSTSYKFFKLKFRFNPAIYNAATDNQVTFAYVFGDYKSDPNSNVLFDDIYTTHNGILDVKDIQNKASMLLYPNPVYDQSKFSLQNVTPGNYSLNIYDLLGRQVETKNVTLPNEITISASELNKGMYLYSLVGEKGNVLNGKFIVQ